MLPHAGTDSRVWREVVELGGDLGRLTPVAGRPVRAEVALLLDWESWWALELDSHPSRLRLAELLREFYRPLFEAGVSASFAHPEGDLSGYRLLLVPALYLVTDAGADNVRRFAADGGTVLISFFSGIVDPSDSPGLWTRPTGSGWAGTRRPGAICSGCGWRSSPRCRRERRSCSITPARAIAGRPAASGRPGAWGRTSSTCAERTRCCASSRDPSRRGRGAGRCCCADRRSGRRAPPTPHGAAPGAAR